MRREAPPRTSSLGNVVSKLASDLAATRAELEATRTLLARREGEIAAAAARHEAAQRIIQVLNRENEALADLHARSDGTLAFLHQTLREQAGIRARQHKSLAAADEDRAWLLRLVDRVLGQLAAMERRPSPLAALAQSLFASAEPPDPGLSDLPPRGRSLLLLALGLDADEVRGVVALAVRERADDGPTPVIATDTPIGVLAGVRIVPLPAPSALRRLPGRLTPDDYLSERILCLCARLVPTRVVAFGPAANKLVAALRSAGETLELTAPAPDPSAHTPTGAAPS